MPSGNEKQLGEICRGQGLLAEAEELANLGSWEHDFETGMVFQSANLRRMLGAEPKTENVPQGDIWRYVDPADRDAVREAIDRGMRTGQPYEFQVRMILPNGRRRVFLVRGKPVVDSQNRVIRRMGVAMDITDKVESATAIRDGAELYRDLVENSHALICTHDLSGRLLSMNELPAQILGYAPQELVGKRIADMLPEHGEELYAEYLARLKENGQATGLMALRTRSGERRIWEYHNTMRTVGVREPVIRGMAHDITERFAAEKRLRKSEALLAQAEELANIGSWEFALVNQTMRCSEQFFRMLRLEPRSEPVLYSQALAAVHPDDRERAQQTVKSLREKGQVFENELRFQTADGQERIFLSRGLAVADGSGRVIAIHGMSQDVTERRREEHRLRRSEELLAQAERLADMGSWELEVETKKLNWSEHFYRLLGLDPAFAPVPYGTGIAMIHPDDRERALRDVESLTQPGHEFENELRFIIGGEERIFHSRAVAVGDKAGRIACIRGMSQDVTERRREEQRLSRSEELLSQAEQMANCGSWEIDLKTRKAMLSRHFLQMLGLESEAEFGPTTYWDRVHHEDRERATKAIEKAIAELKPFEHVSRYLAQDGQTRFHYARGMPQAGPDGKAEISIGVVQDITERVQAEKDLHNLLRKLLTVRDEDRRRLASQLHESVGQTLAALTMTMGRLRRALPRGDTPAHALWRSCQDLAREAARETREISYSMHPHMLDEAGLAPALRCYARDFAELSGINVEVVITDELVRPSREIETAVFRIVQEALTNVHRHSGSRKATIRLSCDAKGLRAEVKDDGRGLPATHFAAARGFSAGVGITGMRERAEQMNGVFELESAPGQGTTIRVTLPLNGTPQTSRPQFSPSEWTEPRNSRKRDGQKMAGASGSEPPASWSR